MSGKKIRRREFLSRAVRGAAAAGLAAPLLGAKERAGIDTSAEAGSGLKREYRVLGKTGLKITTIAFGAMRTRDEAVIHRALDLGVNYIDTARVYMGGLNETIVGQVLKTRRKDAFIATKFKPGSVQEILDSVDSSLKALQTDYLDVIQAHGLRSPEEVAHEDTLEALRSLKKSGKARFVGFTTHSNMTDLLKTAVPMKFYDMILVAYNFKSPPELTAAVEEAAQSGIGIVAMKTQAGGYAEAGMGNLSPHQAALKWVLQNRGVASTIPSMVNYDQLNENVQVMGSKMGLFDRKTLYRYGQAIDHRYCRMCGSCRNQCPHGVDVETANRILMYREGYRDTRLASDAFSDMPVQSRPLACSRCSECAVRCAHGLDVSAKMKRVSRYYV
jgi:aryl-alcohol dehydrogenase-like predicted oxidoreductase